MANTVRVGTQVTGVGKASSDLDKLRDRFDKLQKQGAKGFAIGAGAAITAKGLGLLDAAASGVVGALEGMTEKALADEESQNRLRASLQANLPAFNGNTAAIEQNILAKQRLGFSDETLRDSLTVLVGATHDVTKAQEIQNTAMDLARFKGVDLKTASEALIKVEAGVYRSLKSLGIVLKDGATQTEALAAVQAVAKGQAEAYAQTNRGNLAASQIKVDEAMEHLGATTMPLVVEVMQNAADLAVEVADGLGQVAEAAKKPQGPVEQLWALLNQPITGDTPLGELAAQMNDNIGSLGDFLTFWDGFTHAWERRTKEAVANVGTSLGPGLVGNLGRTGPAIRGIGTSLTGIGTDAKDAGRVVGKSLSGIADDLDALWAHAAGAADQAAEDIFGPMERRAELSANRMAQSAAKGEINKPRQKGETQLDFTQRVSGARADLLNLQKDFFTLTAEMGARGELTAGELGRIREALKDELKGAAAEEAVSLLALMALLDRVAAKAKGVFGVGLGKGGGFPVPTTTRMQGKAHGGPVRKGVPVLVGESHAEVFVPPSDGTIDPRVPQRVSGSSAAGSGGMTDPAILNALNLQTMYLARIAAGEPHAARPMTARGDLARQSALMPGGRL